MTSSPHEVSRVDPNRRPGWLQFVVPELWASLAISFMWLAVLFDAVYGPNFVSSNGASTTTIPSVIVVVVFAFFGTRVVARYGFGHDRNRD
jgi:hypothetical protein